MPASRNSAGNEQQRRARRSGQFVSQRRCGGAAMPKRNFYRQFTHLRRRQSGWHFAKPENGLFNNLHHLPRRNLPTRHAGVTDSFGTSPHGVGLNHLPADLRSPQDLAPMESLSLTPGCPGVFGPVPQPVSMDDDALAAGMA